MSLRLYLTLMLAGTFLTWGAWLLVVWYLDPATADWVGFTLFYVALYLALVGSFSLLGFGARRLITRRELLHRQVTLSFRQSFSFAFLIIATLFLQSKELLNWWNITLLVVALTFFEFAILTYQQRKHPPYA